MLIADLGNLEWKELLVLRTRLFPPTQPSKTGYLSVSKLHTIYWEELGNPTGVPVLFLHGGPGAGIAPIHRCFFDPSYYRIILFDQRGAGKSIPIAECHENTTAELINDIEALREFLAVTEWLIFGGSWGSTLALVYGGSYPNRCKGFILRGIFLGTQCEIEWFINGMGTFFPEANRKFLELLSESERKNPLLSYANRLNDPDPEIHYAAAKVWNSYEEECSTLIFHEKINDLGLTSDVVLALARIEAHYFMNENFIKPGSILKNIKKINRKPTFIIQGRYDVICPISSADRLASLWPEAEYEIIEDAGHSAMEPGITRALIKATESMKSLLAI
jgi:proline iminopeptidase